VSHFTLHPRGPYALAASTAFLEGFAPAAYDGEPGVLRLAFVADPAFAPGGAERAVGVVARAADEAVAVEVFGDAASPAIRAQVARILSLDIDGGGFADVGGRDPVVGRLQRRYPGLRPVLFLSPYEAAAWALIGNRIRIVQAAQLKARLARELGEAVDVAGVTAYAFPGPARLARLDAFPGLSERKVAYLQHLARAATGGLLDAASLRALPPAVALERLQGLPGIGPFGAELILLRGAGEPDRLPTHEPRLARAVALAYGLDQPPTPEALRELAEGWHPYRTWVTLLLRAALEEQTREIAGGSRGPV